MIVEIKINSLLTISRHLKLTAEQKCDIAQRELEELRDEIEKLKDESEKILDNFRVSDRIEIGDTKEKQETSNQTAIIMLLFAYRLSWKKLT